MSAPRAVCGLAAGFLLAACIGVAQAQSIVARVGDVAGRQGEWVDVPITVDMSGAPGLRLGSYRLALRWDPRALQIGDAMPGTFAYPLGNGDSASAGVVRITAIQPSGADGLITLIVARFYIVSDTVPTSLLLDFDEMSAAGTFEPLLPYVTYQQGAFCRALGSWGDVDGDGRANSRDALIALSRVVGLLQARDTISVDTVYVDSVTTRYDTLVTMRPSLADVDADGAVTSRDALIIMTHAVGLPIGDFRVGQRSAGSCTAQGTVTLTVSPDTLELQSLQYALIQVSAHDAAGRPISPTGVVWRSSNPAVAAYFSAEGYSGIRGLDSGVAVLTAELTPTVRASIVVKVVARRVHWYVDAIRATNVPTQTGSARHPMQFIGDALDYAFDGDTIHVASGTYEEVVSGDVSVAILGDPANRPVIDPRAYTSYDPYTTAALEVGSLAGPVTLRDLEIVGGSVRVASSGLVVRDVRIEAPGASDVFYATYAPVGAGAPPAGVRGVAADVPRLSPANALIENLEILGYVNSGIGIEDLDTVVIRNSTVSRDSGGSASGCYGPSTFNAGGIAVMARMHTELGGNTVVRAPCTGVHVLQSGGRAVLSRNRVIGAWTGGIVVSSDTVELDHSVVRDVVTYSEYNAVGIAVGADRPALRVTSLGDSLSSLSQWGFRVDTALVGIIDSLVVDNTDQDHYGERPGVALRGGHFTLRNSHVSDTWGDNGVDVCGWNATLASRGNRITSPGYNGISAWDCTGYADGPDSLISVADTVIDPYDLYATAIRAEDGVYARVDSAVASSGGAMDTVMGVGFEGVGQALLRYAKVTGFGNEAGVYAEFGGSVLMERDSVVGAGWGLWLSSNSDTSRVHRTVVQDSRFVGIRTEMGAILRADSTKVYGSMGAALAFDYNGGGRVSDSWLEDNGFAVDVGAMNGTAALVFRGNTLANSDSLAMRNLSSATVDAQQNWWGQATGPDSAQFVGLVDFSNFLTSAPVLLLTPPVRLSVVAASASGGRASLLATASASRRDSSRGRGGALRGGGRGARTAAAVAPTPAGAAFSRQREGLSHPQPPWQRGRSSNRPAPRHN